jgi:hypothetical protein
MLLSQINKVFFGICKQLINMSKLPPLEIAPLEVVYKNNNYILLKAMDFRWKLPFIFRTYRFLMHVLVKKPPSFGEQTLQVVFYPGFSTCIPGSGEVHKRKTVYNLLNRWHIDTEADIICQVHRISVKLLIGPVHNFFEVSNILCIRVGKPC